MRSATSSSPGPRRREVALDEVRSWLGARIGLGGAPWAPAPLGALYPVLVHQPLHLAARDLLAAAVELLPHPPVPVGLVALSVDLADQREQPLVAERARRARAIATLVVGGRRHVQGPADGLDPEALAMRVDERAHLGRVDS